MRTFHHDRRSSVITGLVCASALAVPAAASAHGNQDNKALASAEYTFDLNAVPHDTTADMGSNVTGTSSFELRGRRLSVSIVANGLDALPHALHIHGKDAGELAFCPGADRRDDLVDDGLIETVEGLDDYGPIQVSLTETGPTDAGESGLALDRFASANAFGRLTYTRTIRIPRQVARDIENKHVVIHGADLNRDGMYGGRITAFGAPLEAELPVACGEVTGR